MPENEVTMFELFLANPPFFVQSWGYPSFSEEAQFIIDAMLAMVEDE